MSQLPNGLTPLTLADGRIVMPSGVVIPSVATQAATTQAEVASGTATAPEQELALAVEVPPPNLASIPVRRLGDLPDIPKVINAVNVVVCYTLFGLPDPDICAATKLSPQQLDKLRASDAYEHMKSAIVRGVLDAEASSVRDLFQQHSRAATMVMVESLRQGSRADRLIAARDHLDRAGHRPADVIEHRHRVDGGLVIEVVRKDERENVPTIEMEIV
jgi:hypothetical protein